MICQECHQPIQNPKSRFCPRCGQRIYRKGNCFICGNPHQPDAKFCDQCGTPTGSTKAPGWNPLPLYCKASGSAIGPGDKHFKCTSCANLYLERYRFKDQPVCIPCAKKDNSTDRLPVQENESDKRLEIRVQAENTKKGIPENQIVQQDVQQTQPNLGISDSDWVRVPDGQFLMGSPESEQGRLYSERPHQVVVKTFEILKTPVTFAMYDAYCDSQLLDRPSDEGWGRGKKPVINVNYWSALGYARWLMRKTEWKLRLPTEAEWEYACRAGSSTAFWTGTTITTDQANFNGIFPYGNAPKGIARNMTTNVDQFAPNALGLHDMHGNVWEWCSSEYTDNYTGLEQLNASNDRDNKSPRTVRGGSWYNLPSSLRSASRNKLSPGMHFLKVGFRLVRLLA